MKTSARPRLRAPLLGAAGFFALGLLAMSASAGPSKLPARRERLPRPQASPLRSLPEPLDLEVISRYLTTMGYEHHRVDEAQNFVVCRIRGKNGIYDLFLLPRKQIIHLQVPKLLQLAAGEHGSSQLTRMLLELNWQNLVGKYSWDPADGEVRYSYSHLVPGGIRFDGFSFAVAQSLATVDADMHGLRKFYERVRGQAGDADAASKVQPGHRPAQGVGRP